MIRRQYDIVLAVFIGLCLVLGGASAPGGGGLFGNFLLQVLAIALVIAGVFAMRGTRTVKTPPPLRWAALAFAAIALLQFVPLPPALWQALPGRGFVADGFTLLDTPAPWLSWSLAPYDSLASLAWLLPALAVCWFASRLLDLRVEIVAIAIIGVALLSVPLEALQVARGADPAWYFYERSSFGQGSGFFANGNHQATFLLVAMTLLCALYATYRSRARTVSATARLAFAFALLVLVVGVVLAGSLAGLGLLLVVLPASVLLMSPRFPLPGPAVLTAAGIAGIALVIVLANLGYQQTGSALEASGPMSRGGIGATTLAAAWDFFPFGSGIGTFADVYRMHEDPMTVTTTFINHAHSDYLEIMLETGLLGIAAVVLFVGWWFRRAVALWTGDRENYFALAATVAIGTVLVHSLVDYPLRTAAVSVLMALCVALTIRPIEPWARKRTGRTHKSKTKAKITI